MVSLNDFEWVAVLLALEDAAMDWAGHVRWYAAALSHGPVVWLSCTACFLIEVEFLVRISLGGGCRNVRSRVLSAGGMHRHGSLRLSTHRPRVPLGMATHGHVSLHYSA